MIEPGETKITYFDGKLVHTVSGKIIEITDEYIRINRRDGKQNIYKRWIVNTEDPPEDQDADS